MSVFIEPFYIVIYNVYMKLLLYGGYYGKASFN